MSNATNYEREILAKSRYSSFDDLIEAWLGRDWVDSMKEDDARELATDCESAVQSGDDRPYDAILADYSEQMDKELAAMAQDARSKSKR